MFQFDANGTLVIASLVLLLGRQCVKHIAILQKYAIPEPIAGGLLLALLFLLIHQTTGWEANFDTSLRDPLMLTFFASIGLNANLASLRAGGKVLVRFFCGRDRAIVAAKHGGYRHGDLARSGSADGTAGRDHHPLGWAWNRRCLERCFYG